MMMVVVVVAWLVLFVVCQHCLGFVCRVQEFLCMQSTSNMLSLLPYYVPHDVKCDCLGESTINRIVLIERTGRIPFLGIAISFHSDSGEKSGRRECHDVAFNSDSAQRCALVHSTGLCACSNVQGNHLFVHGGSGSTCTPT